MDLLSTVVLMLLSALFGVGVAYLFNVRFSREKDKKARNARLRALEQEIKSNILLVNILLVDAKNLAGEGGKPRLLANALQKSQEDWLTLETTLQENLPKLYSEISIYNDHVELLISGATSDSIFLNEFFFFTKSKNIKGLLKACQEALSSITSPDPKK